MADHSMFINIEKRALYNALRMNWLEDRSMDVEPWQVEDYREMDLPLLFSRLRQHSINLDENSFASLSDEVDTPEELTEALLSDREVDEKEEDRIYLLIFELWRKLKSGKPCLSVFCDELDHQIYLYDNGLIENPEQIEDILANLEMILDENADEGADPAEVLETISRGLASDIEAFLYDFICEQADNENYSYASDLLESFDEYLSHSKWFDLLKVKIYIATDPESGEALMEQLAEEALEEKDLEFNLELLNEMVHGGKEENFARLAETNLGLLEKEEDFKDLLQISADYLSCLDFDRQEQEVLQLLQKRESLPDSAPFKNKDSDGERLTALLNFLKR